MGAGNPKFRIWPTMSAGKKAKVTPGNFFRKCQTKLMNVIVRRMVIGGQRHKNVGVRRANRRRIAVGEIDAAVRQANVVDDALDSACGICFRIDCSTRSQRLAVSSMRIPVGARI